MSKRALVFPAELKGAPASLGRPLLAYDPRTGQSEVIVERFVPDAGPDGPLDLVLPLDFLEQVPEPEAPFRAIVVPRRLGSAARLAPLMPGARARACMPALRPPRVPSLGTASLRTDDAELVLTEFPVRVTTTGAQALELARDVLDADELVLELQVLSLFGAMGPADITVELQTAMQNESTAGWVSAGSFTIVTTAPSAELKSFAGLLRYVRWNVSALNGSSPTATFFLSGVRRRWSKAEEVEP